MHFNKAEDIWSMLKNKLTISLGAGFLSVLSGIAVMAAEVHPVLDYDFSAASGGKVIERSGSTLDLTLGKSAVIQKDGIKFDASENAFAAADAKKSADWLRKFPTREFPLHS
jgi:hypothetical protein